MRLFDWLFRRKGKVGGKGLAASARKVSTPRAEPESVASPSQIVDLRSPDLTRAQEEAAFRGARVGDMHVGFRVISVKDGALDHLSIVLAENVSASVSVKYVVWTLDRRPRGGYKSGTYDSDSAEAQRAFDSREL